MCRLDAKKSHAISLKNLSHRQTLAGAIMTHALDADKVFSIEEPKESQPAARGRGLSEAFTPQR